jgi:hypothetical protein
VTHLWPDGRLIAVVADVRGEPRQFTWQAREHQVSEIPRRWRLDEAWWRGRIWRAYYTVITNTGLLAVIYHDLVGGRWYLQRIYD